MNKSELVAAVGAGADLSKQQAERAVDALVAAVVKEVKAGNKVTLIGFGVFNPTARAARAGRNPQTGAPVKIAASKGVRFAAGSTFKAALNNKAGTKKAAVTKAPAKKSSAKKSSAKKAPAKKATVKRAPAKKATAKKSVARTPVKKAVGKKVTSVRKAVKKAAKKR